MEKKVVYIAGLGLSLIHISDETTTAFRLFNQEGDGFGGFTVDLYGEFVVFSWYNPFVFQIKETILAAFQEAFPEVRGGYEKIRFKGLDYESAHVYLSLIHIYSSPASRNHC